MGRWRGRRRRAASTAPSGLDWNRRTRRYDKRRKARSKTGRIGKRRQRIPFQLRQDDYAGGGPSRNAAGFRFRLGDRAQGVQNCRDDWQLTKAKNQNGDADHRTHCVFAHCRLHSIYMITNMFVCSTRSEKRSLLIETDSCLVAWSSTKGTNIIR